MLPLLTLTVAPAVPLTALHPAVLAVVVTIPISLAGKQTRPPKRRPKAGAIAPQATPLMFPGVQFIGNIADVAGKTGDKVQQNTDVPHTNLTSFLQLLLYAMVARSALMQRTGCVILYDLFEI